MNSDEKRFARHSQSSYDNPNLYQQYYSPSRFWDRLTQPGLVISLLALGLFAYHQIASQNPQLLPTLPALIWKFLLYIIPTRLLYAVDGWLNPPLFPHQMLQTQARSYEEKSDVLKRVLRVDKAGSFLASVSQAGSNSFKGLGNIPMVALKGDADQPAGLGNYDNSCYQNSILQGLASLRHLRDYLSNMTIMEERTKTTQQTSTVDTLHSFVEDLNSPKNNGITLWTPSVLKNMNTWQQQDAQEYFSKLLDEVDREIAKVIGSTQQPAGFESEACMAKDDTTGSQHSDDSGYQSVSNHSKAASEHLKLARNPLEGLQAQRVACTACGYSEGLSMIPFNCITLNLGTDGRDHDIYEQLDAFTKVEAISGVECPKCTLLKYQKTVGGLLEQFRAQGRPDAVLKDLSARLDLVTEALEEDNFDDVTMKTLNLKQKVSSTKTKQAAIARPPKSLVVHMNRSVFDEMTGRLLKNFAAVKFPTDLDLGPWCLGSKMTPGKIDHLEHWILDPNLSMVSGSQEKSKVSGPMYELRAVITHYGRHDNGHYVCYKKHGLARQNDRVERPEEPAQPVDADGDVEMLPKEKDLPLDKTSTPAPSDDAHWWRLSDQDVTKVDEETVLGQTGVFMLFYDQVDPSQDFLLDDDMFSDSLSVQAHDAEHQAGEAGGLRRTRGELENCNLMDIDEVTVLNSVPPLDRDEGSL